MLTLGVETSGRIGSIAISRDGECLGESTLDERGRRHAQTLVQEAARLLQDNQLAVSDCQLVAVSIGPGSFTGLRVGVVFAKSFAYANGCDVVAVDTLACIATASPADVNTVYVVEDAQRGELFVGHYRRLPQGSWESVDRIELHDAEQWFAARSTQEVVTGPGVQKCLEKYSADCQILSQQYRTARASVVAELGRLKVQAHAADDLWTLEPFYFRRSAAEEKWESRQHTHESE